MTGDQIMSFVNGPLIRTFMQTDYYSGNAQPQGFESKVLGIMEC